MKITEKLCYGVNENTPRNFLYVKIIILRSYDDENRNKLFLETMQNFKIFQYNHNNSKDSDYFFWQYVNDEGQEDWKHIQLCCYQNNMESVYKMWKLYEICKNVGVNINAEIQFDDIRNLIREIEKESEC